MGKTSEGPPEVSFVDENSCTVRKKVAYVLAFLAVASCIVVGLLVYYVGVMGLEPQCLPVTESSTGGSGGNNTKPDTTTKPPKKPKVSQCIFPMKTINLIQYMWLVGCFTLAKWNKARSARF